jgi:AcrR family transcriptional regulator
MPRAAAARKRDHDLPGRRAGHAASSPDSLAEEIMESMLVTVGKKGYREATVEQVLAGFGGHRIQFWERFESKEECFEAAYRSWLDRLVTEILTAASAESEWRLQLRAGVVAFLEFVEARPAIARALLLEPEAAGDPTRSQREETIARLGEAIDTVREQVPDEERPPPLTGVFVAGGIASFAANQLAGNSLAELWQGLPELIDFAVGPYLGEEAAEQEAAAAEELLACR